MRVIVTGATSFIGKAVTKELLAGGHHVFAVVRPDSPGRSRLEMLAGEQRENLTFLPFALKDIGKLESCPELCPIPPKKADLWLHLGWEGAGSANRQVPFQRLPGRVRHCGRRYGGGDFVSSCV